MTDLEWLVSNGFERVGCWARPAPKLLRTPTGDELRRQPGIYAFIIDGTLRYLGKAAHIRSRLRGYNRSLAVETTGRSAGHIAVSSQLGPPIRLLTFGPVHAPAILLKN